MNSVTDCQYVRHIEIDRFAYTTYSIPLPFHSIQHNHQDTFDFYPPLLSFCTISSFLFFLQGMVPIVVKAQGYPRGIPSLSTIKSPLYIPITDSTMKVLMYFLTCLQIPPQAELKSVVDKVKDFFGNTVGSIKESFGSISSLSTGSQEQTDNPANSKDKK